MGAVTSQAQVDREYFARTQPYPVYKAPETARYNIKLGRLTANFSADIQSEFNDNINLSQTNPQSDFSIGPYIGVGFLWPITKYNVVHMDMGVGYRWYLNNPSASSISVAPDTHLDYTLFIGDVQLAFHDQFSIQVDPLSVGNISGPSGSVASFRRLINTSGLYANWQASRDVGLYAGYDYTLERTISGSFASLDRDSHSLFSGVNYRLSPRMTVGFMGSYNFFYYLEHIQNDGDGYSIGPTLSLKLSKFLSATASASYSSSSFAQTGTILDQSSFGGPTFQFGLQHTLSPRSSESLRAGDSIGAGFGSNYTETKFVQYGLTTMLTKAVSLNFIFAFENLDASIGPTVGGEHAQRYMFYLGSGYQFSRAWSAGVSYSLSFKNSDLPGFDYVQNRLTLDLTRRF